MTLNEYFSEEPRGAKSEMAAYLGISLTWLSLVINGKRKVSPKLALAIEEATQGLVKKADLRPDLFS
jgi:DNA-binding transcriptional regulator YdaS (Cro superfamily)